MKLRNAFLFYGMAIFLVLSLLTAGFSLPGNAQTPSRDQITSVSPTTQTGNEITEEVGMTLFDLLSAGGWIMVVLAILSILALSLAIYYMITLTEKKIVPNDIVTQIRHYIRDGRYDDVARICRRSKGMFCKVIHAGLSRGLTDPASVASTMEAVGRREAERILERLTTAQRVGLQTREIVIPSKDSNWHDMFARVQKAGAPDPATMNRLIYGDNLLAMAALLAGDADTPPMRGKIDLIYIDPPFDSKADYRTKITLPSGQIEQRPTVLEQFAYSDMWERGTESYLAAMVPRLILMREMLSDQGSIYVHLDWHVGHYVKVVMDEIFGRDCFLNEITWKRRTGTASSNNAYGSQTDSLMLFSNSKNQIFNPQYQKEGITKEEIEKKFHLVMNIKGTSLL